MSALPVKADIRRGRRNVRFVHEQTHAPQQKQLYSITLSARASSVAGIVRPSALACDAALAGLGIIEEFSYLLADSISSRQLIPLLQDFQPPPQPVNFLYSPNRFMPTKLRAFLDFAVPRLKERLAVPKGMAPRNSAGNRTCRG